MFYSFPCVYGVGLCRESAHHKKIKPCTWYSLGDKEASCKAVIFELRECDKVTKQRVTGGLWWFCVAVVGDWRKMEGEYLKVMGGKLAAVGWGRREREYKLKLEQRSG